MIVSIFCLVLLVAAASGLRKLELGNPIISGLPHSTDVRQGYEVAGEHLGPGVVGPTMLSTASSSVASRGSTFDQNTIFCR